MESRTESKSFSQLMRHAEVFFNQKGRPQDSQIDIKPQKISELTFLRLVAQCRKSLTETSILAKCFVSPKNEGALRLKKSSNYKYLSSDGPYNRFF